MIDIKRSIILEEGTNVSVVDVHDDDFSYRTTALLGKSTKQFFSEVSLESHRQLQFIPEDEVYNGLIVHNEVVNESYIIVAKYYEIIYNELCATVTRAIVCNSRLSLSRLVEVADRFGNIKREFETLYEDIPIYMEAIDSKMVSAKPGEFEEVKYKIFAPTIPVEVTDQLELQVNGVMKPFKLTGRDYTTFEGLVVLDVISETRRG